MATTSLQDLYGNKLQMMLDAENQILQALPQLEEAVQNGELRTALEKHRRETQGHAQRLQQLVDKRGMKAGSTECKSMHALIQEAQTMLQKIEEPDTIDAFVIAGAQAVEHHEIAAYGTARAWANQLGYSDDAAVLQQTLDEENKADQTLTKIAERSVNGQASQGADREVQLQSGGQADLGFGGNSSANRPASSDSVSRAADGR
jgi:ferritin-like metal-binding protein YciE